MHRFAVIFILALLSTACATYGDYSSKAMSLQMGMSKDQVLALLGEPKKVSARTDDNKLVERYSWWSPKMIGFTPVDNEVLSTDRVFVQFVDGKVAEWGDSYDFGATTSRSVDMQADMLKSMQEYYKATAPKKE